MKNIITWIQQVTKKLTALDLARLELAAASVSLLEAQSTKEYAEALVQYHTARISRLQRSIHISQHPATK